MVSIAKPSAAATSAMSTIIFSLSNSTTSCPVHRRVCSETDELPLDVCLPLATIPVNDRTNRSYESHLGGLLDGDVGSLHA
jgi:hypothetical protein